MGFMDQVEEFLGRFQDAWSQLLYCITGEDVEDRMQCVSDTVSSNPDVFGISLIGALAFILLITGGKEEEKAKIIVEEGKVEIVTE